MLYKGENRLLTNIFSLTFVKIITMTATKFLIQSYIVSIAIKSLMYKFVSKFQYFPPNTEDNELFRDLEEHYYRGLTNVREVLTFTEATLIIPLVMIAILYLPSIFYIAYASLKFYGKEKWSTSILADPVHFIFPIFTCMSFYHRNDNIMRKKEVQLGENVESVVSSEDKKEAQDDDLVNLQNDPTGENSKQVSPRMNNIIVKDVDAEAQNVDQNSQIIRTEEGVESGKVSDSQIEENSAPPRIFSVRQSNVLYFLFFIGAAFCIGGDILMQYQR